MADDTRKSELIADLAKARAELTARARVARRELDFAARWKASFRRHALSWLGGAGLLGLLMTWPRGRKKVVVKPLWQRKDTPEEKVVKTGLLLTVLKITFDLFRPALTKWVTNRVTDYASAGFSKRKQT